MDDSTLARLLLSGAGATFVLVASVGGVIALQVDSRFVQLRLVVFAAVALVAAAAFVHAARTVGDA
jgi:hypothetical protein